MSNSSVDRRDFLRTTAAAGAALTLTAASARRVYGANENLRVAFLGVGGRCQQHLDVILQMQKEGKKVVPVAVCDVWDGGPKLGSGKGRGLYPSAKRCGINQDDKDRVTKEPLARRVTERIFMECVRRGLLTMSYSASFRLQPSLTIDAATARNGIEILREVFDLVARERLWE